MSRADRHEVGTINGRVRATVILPVWNGAQHLPATLDRLRRLPGDDVEIIVVDDGSTDSSADIAQRYADLDPRFRILRQPANAGVARARNRAVTESRGEWLWFVDGDDAWPGEALDTLLAVADRSHADVIVAAARFVYRAGAEVRDIPAPSGEPVDGATAFRMLLRNEITGHLWNKLFRADVLRAIEWVYAPVHSDLPMVAGALALASRVAFCADVVYDYQVRPGSVITASGRRADSLALVGDAVRRIAQRLDPGLLDSDDWRYFELRTITLSELKDATLGPYDRAQRSQLLRRLRRRLTSREFALLARRRDRNRLIFALAAKTDVRLHRVVLRLAERSGADRQTPAAGALDRPERMLLVASTGGHLVQLLRLLPRLNADEDSLWVTFRTPQSEQLLAGRNVVWVPYIRPRDWRGVLRTAASVPKLLREQRVDRVVSTGAAIALAVLPIARTTGLPTQYIESVSRLDGPSLTGRLLARMPGIDLFTQHARWAGRRWQPVTSVMSAYKAIEREGAAESPQLFVTLGTIEGYRFDSLVDAVLDTGLADDRTIWQVGFTERSDLPGTVKQSMAPDDFDAAVRESDVVIMHAGVGTLLGVLETGKKPVLVPRRAERDEHVDDHQAEIAAFAAESGVGVVAEVGDLGRDHIFAAANAAVVPANESPVSDDPRTRGR